jgi:hypothetical protein
LPKATESFEGGDLAVGRYEALAEYAMSKVREKKPLDS